MTAPVDIWRFRDLAQPDLQSACAAVLSGEEREHLARLRIDKVRRRFVVSKGGLRRVLAHYLQAPPQDLILGRGPQGKPYLVNAAGQPDCRLRFNVSHTDEIVVIAVSQFQEVGIDIEEFRRESDFDAIAERFFAPMEREAVRAAQGDAKAAVFLHIWTCKEALLKVTGQGIVAGLDLLSVNPDPDQPPQMLTPHPDWPAQTVFHLARIEGPGLETCHCILATLGEPPAWRMRKTSELA